MSVQQLLHTLPQSGRLEWIGLRRAHRGKVESVREARAEPGRGLLGDHRSARPDPRPEGKRHVTLIQAEHLPVIAALSARDVTFGTLRRNLAVSGINLLALKDRRFFVGEVLLEGTGLCHPCSRMEEALGPGGYNAVRGHGGILARVLTAGTLRVGDEVRPAD